MIHLVRSVVFWNIIFEEALFLSVLCAPYQLQPGADMRLPVAYSPHIKAVAQTDYNSVHPNSHFQPSAYLPADSATGGIPGLRDAHLAPKYMLELYRKFETDQYSHPMANIVRSFINIYQDPINQRMFQNNATRRHLLVFNISSVSRDEEIHLAELRLYTLVENDRKYYYGSDRRVSIYEVQDKNNRVGVSFYSFLGTRNIHGSNSGWETFTVTDHFKRWVKDKDEEKTLEVRIENEYSNSRLLTPPDVDVDTKADHEHGPLLVVFSNDKRKRKSEQKEMLELFKHATATEDYATTNEDPHYEDYEYDDEYDENTNKITKRDVSEERHRRDVSGVEERHPSTINNSALSRGLNFKAPPRFRNNLVHKLYQHFVNNTSQENESNRTSNESNVPRYRTKRNESNVPRYRTKRRVRDRSRARHPCKRKPLYVKFEDINWHKWIIAPEGYEAFQCSGQCHFPLSEHLTPTKYAIIQSLLHTTQPKKTETACCVPTVLEPISILYADEDGVVTYKYKYEGMVVAECGCR